MNGEDNGHKLHSLWLEGNSSWASSTLLFGTADPQRRHLLAAINRQPATLEELAALPETETAQVATDLAVMERLNLVRKDSKHCYVPSFPILSTDDMKQLMPLVEPAMEDYCRIITELAPELDQLLYDLGLTPNSRLAFFLGFARDELAYNEIKRRGLFPAETKKIAGMECIYAAEPFAPLDSYPRPGLIHSANGNYRLLYNRGTFRNRHLFTRWGFEFPNRATPALTAIMEQLNTPRTVVQLAQQLADKGDVAGLDKLLKEGHLPSVLNYLANQGWVSWQQHWQAQPIVITDSNIKKLAELVAPASNVIADLVQHNTLGDIYPATSPGRHQVPLPMFRAAVAWKTTSTATGMLAAQGYFPTDDRELYIFHTEQTATA